MSLFAVAYQNDFDVNVYHDRMTERKEGQPLVMLG